jgi:crooked neck
MKPSKHKIMDQVELDEFRNRKRKNFEDTLMRNKNNFGVWVKYGLFEESQHEFERCRSVFERALGIDHRNETLWMRYVEIEMKHKNVNHARNIFERAITVLPRVDQFWYKYAYMEELLGNINGARQIFERWLKWEPEEQAYILYIKMEKRYKEKEKITSIYSRFINVHPEPKNWIKWAKFEEGRGNIESTRNIFKKSIEFLSENAPNESVSLYVAYAQFETRRKEVERARNIYNHALKEIPDDSKELIYSKFLLFEKQFGLKSNIEDVLLNKKRDEYEREISDASFKPGNYDVFFDYCKLEENIVFPLLDCLKILDNDVQFQTSVDKCRLVYEKAISKVPPVLEKKYWRRYIYLWINYAVFEELIGENERSRNIYHRCLDIIPHKLFTFAKVWLFYAQFEIRRKNLGVARKYLGRSLGVCPKEKLFKGYIELEMELREFDRCRKLYEKFLLFSPTSSFAWLKFAELESLLDDSDRARAIYELALSQPLLDIPEVVWKNYIDFETGENEYSNVRKIFRRLLEKTSHPKVWSSFAAFEYELQGIDSLSISRKIYEEGYERLKLDGLQEQRKLLLELWIKCEMDREEMDFVENLEKRLPQKTTRRRKLEDGSFEEYMEYLFPDDQEKATGVSKLMEMAKRWKEAQKNSLEK